MALPGNNGLPAKCERWVGFTQPQYFSPSFHRVKTCQYNSIRPNIRHIFIYWVSSRFERMWEVRRLGKTLKPLSWSRKAWLLEGSLLSMPGTQNLIKGQKVKSRVLIPTFFSHHLNLKDYFSFHLKCYFIFFLGRYYRVSCLFMYFLIFLMRFKNLTTRLWLFCFCLDGFNLKIAS